MGSQAVARNADPLPKVSRFLGPALQMRARI